MQSAPTSNLVCVNCGAVYADHWSSAASPICPYCCYSHYQDTSASIRPPAKKKYRVYESSSPQPERGEGVFWSRYQQANAAVTRSVEPIDAAVGHLAALRYARSKWDMSMARLVICIRRDSCRRNRDMWFELDEEEASQDMNRLPARSRVEDAALAYLEVEALERVWRRTGMDDISLQDAFLLARPDPVTDSQAFRRYERIRLRRWRFCHKIEKLDVSASAII